MLVSPHLLIQSPSQKIAKTSKTPGRTRSLVFFEFEKNKDC